MRQQVQSLPRCQRVVWTDPGVCCARGMGMVLWCTQVSHTACPQDHCGEECTPITPKTAPGPEHRHTTFPWLRRELSLSSQGVLGSFEIISSRKGCRHGGVPLGSPRSVGREAGWRSHCSGILPAGWKFDKPIGGDVTCELAMWEKALRESCVYDRKFMKCKLFTNHPTK